MNTNKDKPFKFKVNGNLVFFNFPHHRRVEKIIRKGFGWFKRTTIITDGRGWWDIKLRFIFWFTSDIEHNEIVESFNDWLYGEKFIEAL